MIDLPPPRLALCDRCDYIANDGKVSQAGFTLDQMNAHGEACARAALEAAAQIAENTYEGSNANAHFSAAAIRDLKVTP